MILQIDWAFYDKMTAPDRAQLYCDMILRGHYIDCPPKLRDSFYKDIETHGSTLQKNIKEKDPSLSIPTMFKQYLTKVDVNTITINQLKTMVEKPALLMVENEANERRVYYEIIREYAKKDKSYNSLFVKLKEAVDNGDLDFDQAGGDSQLAPLFSSHDRGKYQGTAKQKICMLSDRDTDNNTSYDKSKNSFFTFVCGKNSSTVVDADIYSNEQSPYIWHMWYFRAIENYFPPKQFIALGLDPSKAEGVSPDWHYKKLGTIPGYKKDQLDQLTKGMSYDDYEDGLQHFPSPDGPSEIQLFLLKLVRII